MMYIGGEWVNADDDGKRPVVNPATEEVVAVASYGGGAEARRAVKEAHRAFPEWSKRTPYERSAFLYDISRKIRDRSSELGNLLTQEVGKPLSESLGEVKGSADQFEWYAEEVKRQGGEVIPNKTSDKRYFTLRHPLGVVGAIAPWNFPLLLLSRKIAPALAAGCTVVARPASRTPMAVGRMFDLIDEANLPCGVANLIYGNADEQSTAMMDMPELSKISFTGSSEVGKGLMRKASGSLKKLSLELGGHAPYLIFDDIDPDVAAEKATYSKFRNMGQVCISPSRFYVQESIFDDFVNEAVERVGSFRLGNGLEEGVTHGPLHSSEQLVRTQELVDDILENGGKILAGGRKPSEFDKGFYYEPTIATGLTGDMRIMNEEPFSPIMPVMPFTAEEDAIEKANDTPYGLAAYLLTKRLDTAIRMIEGLEAGIIALNDTSPANSCCPFGGMKQSGMGREGWHEGLDGYYETKYVSVLMD